MYLHVKVPAEILKIMDDIWLEGNLGVYFFFNLSFLESLLVVLLMVSNNLENFLTALMFNPIRPATSK